ncbi:MAG: hypothetical protein ABFC38_01300 [Methanospirillum sp.]
MQRRHAIIAAIALVALVLIPAAALASGFHSGFGHRGEPGVANATHGTPNWTANATHPNWTPGDGPGNRTFHGNATCTVNASCSRDATNRTCDQDRIGNRTAANQTHALGESRNIGPQDRAGRGIGG